MAVFAALVVVACAGGGGSGSANGPVVQAFAASANNLRAAQSTRLSWTVTGAQSCAIDQGVGTVPCTGSQTVTPGTTRMYTLTATNAEGSSTATVLVEAGGTGRYVFVVDNGSALATGYAVDPATGSLGFLGSAPTGADAQGVAVHPSGRFLYVANAGSDTVSMYGVDRDTGAIAPAGTVAAGNQPTEIAIDPTGRFAYVVNANGGGAGTLSAYTIDGSGQLQPNGPPAALFNGSDSVTVDGGGRFVYAISLSNNLITQFAIQADGTLQNLGNTAVLQPSQIAADPTGRFVYLATLGGGVAAYIISPDGTMSALGSTGVQTFSSVAVDGTGRFVYAGNPVTNQLQLFTINQNTGVVAASGAPVQLNFIPNGIASDPGGTFLYVAGAAPASVQAFQIDPTTGALTPVSTIPSPGEARGVVVTR
jgi:6-phosphogluconolactonase (cycloisomerase 2 family)